MLSRFQISPALRQVLSIVTFSATVVGAYFAGFRHGSDETFATLVCKGANASIIRQTNDPIRSAINHALCLCDDLQPGR